MKIFGIIAEYNPFHNGHKYQLDVARSLGATHIVAIMSPNFTQRGEPSITDKFYRSKAAINSGVDLVIELPTYYALSSAEKFAFGAIYLLNKTNVIDNLIFGVEMNNLDLLNKIVNIIESDEFNKKLSQALKYGLSFAKTRQCVLEKFLNNDIVQEITKPNNILAIEYIKSLKRLNSSITPLPIKRIGVNHNAENTFNQFTSALNLRKLAENRKFKLEWEKFTPTSAYKIYEEAFKNGHLPALEKIGERIILAHLRTLSINNIKILPDISEGLEHRIFKSIQKASSLEEIYYNIKTKRYTMSRIKRIVYNSLLGINLEKSQLLPQYIRILASNKKGIAIISKIKKSSNIPISSSLKKLANLNNTAQILANIEVNATNIHSLFCNNISICNRDYNNFFNIT